MCWQSQILFTGSGTKLACLNHTVIDFILPSVHFPCFMGSLFIHTILNGHFSIPKSMNSYLPQSSVLSLTLCSVNNLSKINCSIHSCANLFCYMDNRCGLWLGSGCTTGNMWLSRMLKCVAWYHLEGWCNKCSGGKEMQSQGTELCPQEEKAKMVQIFGE